MRLFYYLFIYYLFWIRLIRFANEFCTSFTVVGLDCGPNWLVWCVIRAMAHGDIINLRNSQSTQHL